MPGGIIIHWFLCVVQKKEFLKNVSQKLTFQLSNTIEKPVLRVEIISWEWQCTLEFVQQLVGLPSIDSFVMFERNNLQKCVPETHLSVEKYCWDNRWELRPSVGNGSWTCQFCLSFLQLRKCLTNLWTFFPWIKMLSHVS